MVQGNVPHVFHPGLDPGQGNNYKNVMYIFIEVASCESRNNSLFDSFRLWLLKRANSRIVAARVREFTTIEFFCEFSVFLNAGRFCQKLARLLNII